ncbi:MAG: DUF2281 domain-containing protein [Sphingobacteriales bacterium]
MELGTLEKKIAKLPEKPKLKVEFFVDTLISKTNGIEKTTSTANNSGYGSLKGQIWMSDDFSEHSQEKPRQKREFGGLNGFVTYMADDFDAPLNDFKDYM